MFDAFQDLFSQTGFDPGTFVVAAIAGGTFLAFWGVMSFFRSPDPAVVRITAISSDTRRLARQNRGLLRPAENTPKGFMKSFVPADGAKRSELSRKLSQAGFPGAGALMKFTLVRIFLGLVLPGVLIGGILLARSPETANIFVRVEFISQMSNLQIYQLLSVCVAVGYCGPTFWLNSRAGERRRRILEGFPNALDLMQISVESGLGFDAAMTRVGNELVKVSPDIAFEFLTVQTQIQAGRNRDAALHEMAERTGVDVVRSFANVVTQSMMLGTSMTESLNTYSTELREHRELQAEEMANKLPVKMSGVLACLMLPALVLLTVGPVLIRYIRLYG